MSPIPVVMLRHTGPYEKIGAVFDQITDWASRHQVPIMRTIGIYWDNPDYVPAAQLRSAASLEVPSSFQIEGESAGITRGEIAGGPFVTTKFVGPYEDLASVWSDLTRYVEKTLKKKISVQPAFEVYVNDPSDTPPDRLITELYLPVI